MIIEVDSRRASANRGTMWMGNPAAVKPQNECDVA